MSIRKTQNLLLDSLQFYADNFLVPTGVFVFSFVTLVIASFTASSGGILLTEIGLIVLVVFTIVARVLSLQMSGTHVKKTSDEFYHTNAFLILMSYVISFLLCLGAFYIGKILLFIPAFVFGLWYCVYLFPSVTEKNRNSQTKEITITSVHAHFIRVFFPVLLYVTFALVVITVFGTGLEGYLDVAISFGSPFGLIYFYFLYTDLKHEHLTVETHTETLKRSVKKS